jgi:ABC-type dipeptide/oligopeptide/nickel transport system permease component
MVNSVSDRDVPMITGLTFLTSVIYVISLLLTDILYAVFDPRVRLR